MNLEELRKQSEALKRKVNSVIDDTDSIINETIRVKKVAHNSKQILVDLDKEFEKQTKLNKIDVTFLFFATALQCVRQYILTDFKERFDDKTTANNTKGKSEEHSDRSHKFYHPSLSEIITNPVPFDAIYGSKEKGLNIGGGFNHRARTLGHDPLLGWIFGTANILTSTITISDFRSFHVKTGTLNNGTRRDKISERASLGKIFKYSSNRLLKEGMEGKGAVGSSILKEAIHLKSDVGSKVSLPLPIISTISPEFASQIAEYGFDTANVITVAKQAGYATLINSIVAMIHRLFYDETQFVNKKEYEVKTRKILSYSNLIASTSNVLYVAISSFLGDETSLRKLDVGGIIVTIYRLVNDPKFIREVKEEFVLGRFNEMILSFK